MKPIAPLAAVLAGLVLLVFGYRQHSWPGDGTGTASAAQTPAVPAAAKQTLMVPMRDGTKLATDVYLPEGGGKGPFPVVLLRSPYNKDGLAGLGADAVRRGYVLVAQDTRGRFASQGKNLPFEADGWWDNRWDGYDTVEWVARQTWCNGKIGTMGGSALGITQLLLAGTGTPRIDAQHISVATPDLYADLAYRGGVFRKSLVEDWMRMVRFDPAALPLWTSHPAADAFWRERSLGPRYAKANAPAAHIGGWYDLFAQGTIDAFLGYQTRGGPKARGRQKLVIGPWTHGILQDRAGELTFPNGKSPPNDVHDPWRWFDHHLKGVDNGIAKTPAVTYYVLGDVSAPNAPGNVWRTAERWPPPGARETPF